MWVFLLSILGIGCSVALWWGAMASERPLVQWKFRSAASNRVLAIEREIGALHSKARAVRAILISHRDTSRAELGEFLTSLSGVNGIPLALEYRLRDKSQRFDPAGMMKSWPSEMKLYGAYFAACESRKGKTCLGVRIAMPGGSLDLFAPIEALAERGLHIWLSTASTSACSRGGA